jgi:hypothetical protein
LAAQRVEREFPGKTSQEIFDRAARSIDEIAGRYSLKHRPEPAALSGQVSRAGVEGRYRVLGERLTLDLDFSFLIPGPIRQRVREEVEARLGTLFS